MPHETKIKLISGRWHVNQKPIKLCTPNEKIYFDKYIKQINNEREIA